MALVLKIIDEGVIDVSVESKSEYIESMLIFQFVFVQP
jgi:hypothetical protein